MLRRLGQQQSRDAAFSHLGRSGPSSAAAICAAVGISQPTFSRLVASNRDQLLVAGRARATRYALRRVVRDLPPSLPVYLLGDSGQPPREWLRLHPIEPDGFYIDEAGAPPSFSRGLPWFLDDLRPTGFLGRLLPRLHPELAAPPDIRLWSAEDTLRYLARYGWNNIGDLVVGEDAYRLLMQSVRDPPDAIEGADRARRYPELAEEVLRHGLPGSSAAGEQPKFLATRRDAQAEVPVLVKFSPPVFDSVSRRLADLLVCEHIAHGILPRHGQESARSTLLSSAARVFLEVERFDRDGLRSRRGLYTLGALDQEWVGSRLDRWSTSAAGLLREGVIDIDTERRVRWLELFGRLIANTDMHRGNLSFFASGRRVTGLAPAYDMLPTMYSPQSGQLVDRRFEPPLPAPSEADVWPGAWRAAVEYWTAITGDGRVSEPMRAIADANARAVQEMDAAARMLPAPRGVRTR